MPRHPPYQNAQGYMVLRAPDRFRIVIEGSTNEWVAQTVVHKQFDHAIGALLAGNEAPLDAFERFGMRATVEDGTPNDPKHLRIETALAHATALDVRIGWTCRQMPHGWRVTCWLLKGKRRRRFDIDFDAPNELQHALDLAALRATIAMQGRKPARDAGTKKGAPEGAPGRG